MKGAKVGPFFILRPFQEINFKFRLGKNQRIFYFCGLFKCNTDKPIKKCSRKVMKRYSY